MNSGNGNNIPGYVVILHSQGYLLMFYIPYYISMGVQSLPRHCTRDRFFLHRLSGDYFIMV